MREVLEFRKSVRAWLIGIAGMDAQVGDRVIYGWPVTPPTFPLITFGLARAPEGEYTHHAWQVVLTVSIHSEDPDTLDAVEDLVIEDVAKAGADINDTLSTASKTAVQAFRLEDVGNDEQTLRPDTGTYYCTSRPLTFACALIGLSEG